MCIFFCHFLCSVVILAIFVKFFLKKCKYSCKYQKSNILPLICKLRKLNLCYTNTSLDSSCSNLPGIVMILTPPSAYGYLVYILFFSSCIRTTWTYSCLGCRTSQQYPACQQFAHYRSSRWSSWPSGLGDDNGVKTSCLLMWLTVWIQIDSSKALLFWACLKSKSIDILVFCRLLVIKNALIPYIYL